MPRGSLTAVFFFAVALAPANATDVPLPLDGLDQIAAVIGAALPPECVVQPFLDPPALIIRDFLIDEPPEGDLGIEVWLGLTDECAAIAEQALRAAREELTVNGLRAVGFFRASTAVIVYYG